MENTIELTYPDSLDGQIERLYRELMAIEGEIARLRDHSSDRTDTRRIEIDQEIESLKVRADLTHRLIADYSQLDIRLSIEGQADYIQEPQELLGIDLEREKDILWFRRQLKAWAKENLRDFPWRQTTDPYAVLIAETFLQQTKAERVATLYRPFMERYPNLKSLADASVEDISRAIAPLGLAFRASRLHELAHRLLENSTEGGKIPDSAVELLRLPGVGRYTANAILAGAFGHRAPVLDTNVARILERFFGLEGGRVKSRDGMLWDAAAEVAPRRDVKRWNWTLIDFGALVCTARHPGCRFCPLGKQCHFGRVNIKLLI